MEKVFSRLKLQVVKEEGKEYSSTGPMDNPEAVYKKCISMEMDKEPEEVMLLFTLDMKLYPTGCFEVSRGNLNSCLVHPREIFKRAILQNSARIILVHNHPSGDIFPSDEDKKVTGIIKRCGEILCIPLVDHIIVGDNEFFSFKEREIL
jgi:DNA repair protein RadC